VTQNRGRACFHSFRDFWWHILHGEDARTLQCALEINYMVRWKLLLDRFSTDFHGPQTVGWRIGDISKTDMSLRWKETALFEQLGAWVTLFGVMHISRKYRNSARAVGASSQWACLNPFAFNTSLWTSSRPLRSWLLDECSPAGPVLSVSLPCFICLCVSSRMLFGWKQYRVASVVIYIYIYIYTQTNMHWTKIVRGSQYFEISQGVKKTQTRCRPWTNKNKQIL